MKFPRDDRPIAKDFVGPRSVNCESNYYQRS
jgi:hypothetical protein